MNKWIRNSGLLLLLVAMSFGGVTYYNYQQDEKEIAEVTRFKETALKAFQALGYEKIDTALSLYEQALRIHDEDAKTMADYALALKKGGRLNEAADSYLKSYFLDTIQNEKHLGNAGLLYLQQQKYHEAMAVYETLLKEHKRLYRYVEKIALCAFQIGAEEKALAYYAYIAEKEPGWFEDKKEFAELKALYDSQKEKINAIDLREVHEKTSDIAELKQAAAGLVNDHYDKQAVFTYQKIIELEPQNDEVRKVAAKIYLKHGNYVNALELLEGVEEKKFDTWFTIGGIHHENRRYRLALESYEKALEFKKDVQLLKNMSACAYYLNDKEALAQYFTALEKKDILVAYKFKHAVAINQGLEESKKDRLLHHAKLIWCSIVSRPWRIITAW